MHKVMRTAVVTALLAIAPIAAQADGQAFITASAGKSHYNGDTGESGTYSYYGIDATERVDKKDTAFGVTGGYRWMMDDVFSIGPEAGFVDLGKLSDRVNATSPGRWTETDRSEIKNKAALLGINAKWMLGHSWSLGLRTGFLHMWSRLRSDVDGVDLYYSPGSRDHYSYKDSSHDNGFYGALNVGYDFTRNFGVTLGYEHYHGDYKSDAGSVSQKIGVWAAGAEFRF
ncbi:outer membrane beta-barrel protein [Luteibacter sp. 9133]|uniref:outer membrane beta-barrel protein n=1 Tax=Luteibacter sp. 9133 TaxID=1500891 RepID=UPI0005BA67A4|nr:outer membrane beta-barrel protein [Luteibacter sp. 9133]